MCVVFVLFRFGHLVLKRLLLGLTPDSHALAEAMYSRLEGEALHCTHTACTALHCTGLH